MVKLTQEQMEELVQAVEKSRNSRDFENARSMDALDMSEVSYIPSSYRRISVCQFVGSLRALAPTKKGWY